MNIKILLIVLLILSLSFILVIQTLPLHSARENADAEHQAILSFLEGEELTLPLTAEEASHMQDVRVLHNAFKVLVIILALLTPYYFDKKVLEKLWIPIVVILGIALIAFLFPHQLFDLFHNVFFPQGNFTFPVDSFLITLYPATYFFSLAYWTLGITTGILLILYLGSILQHRLLT